MREFIKKHSKPSLVLLAFTFVYAVTLLASGFNFLAPISAGIMAACALLIFLRELARKPFEPVYSYAYALTLASTFIYLVAWGADDIGKKIWYNIVLSIVPALCTVGIILINGNCFTLKENIKRIVSACMAFVMTGTAVVMVFFMSLRAKPTAESLQEGHDAYLKRLSAQKASADAPNVLVILMDDMAYSDISAYSYLGQEAATIQTPNIDAIAEEGIFMENFYASAPVCTPSRFSLLTGRYAARGYIDNVIFPTVTDSDPYSMTHFVNPYQFLNNVDGILGDEITIAEALQAIGYDTSCIGKWNLGDYGEYLPMNQGFDYFYGSYYVNDMTPYNWVREENGVATEVRSHTDNLDQSESTKLFTQEVISNIKKSTSQNNPFFMFYATPWPHYPIYSDKNGNGTGDTTDDSYIACIEEFDAYLGTIIETLKAEGVYDDTMIIFTSDNGPGREGVTGALRGRKNTTFDGGMKVPMLVSYPGGDVKSGGYKIESSAMLTDLFPTILSYAGITDLPDDRIIDGVNLRGLWNGTFAPDQRVHEDLFYMKKGSVQAVQMPVEVDGKTYDYKYYDRVLTENSAFIDQFYKNYLFNLDTDPAEGYNVSMTYPEVAKKLNERLEAFRKELRENRRGKK